TSSVSFCEETVKRDVILIMETEATFDLFPYGFIDKAYEIYGLSADEKRKAITAKINDDPQWKAAIKQKARDNKLSENEQMKRDVEYILQKDYCPVKAPVSLYD